MIEYLRSLESSDLLQEYGSGKGIVFTAGSEVSSRLSSAVENRESSLLTFS